MAAWWLPLCICAPIVLAGAIACGGRRAAALGYRSAALLLILLTAGLLSSIPLEQAISWHSTWLPALDLAIDLRLDGWGLLIAVIIGGIGAAICLWAGPAQADDPERGRLLAWLLTFIGAMFALVMSDHLLLTYAAWEGTTVASYFLIGHRRSDDARQAARQALLVTGLGGLALLGGLVLLGTSSGCWHFSQLPHLSTSHDPLVNAALLLLILGAATKSALWPWQFWLPAAMVAPTAVSALLHSATMVKAGVFLLGRLHPCLGTHPWWEPILSTLSVITMAVITLGLWRQRDLKALLATSTVAALALITWLIGHGALYAAAAVLLAHAAYKATLFLIAGSIDHACACRDSDRLGGLARPLPILAASAALAGWSVLGLPGSLGASGKALATTATSHALQPLLISMLGCTVAAVTVAVAILPFWRRPTNPAITSKHPPTVGQYAAIGGLSLTGFLGLIVPVDHLLVAPAASALSAPYLANAQHHPATSILPWLALVLGISLWFSGRRPLARLATVLLGDGGIRFERLWQGLLRGARLLTKAVQHGSLRGHILTVLGLGLGSALLAAQAYPVPSALPSTAAFSPSSATLALLSAIAAICCVCARSPLATIAALGGVGTGVTGLFLLHSAPDLAITQFLIEILTVLLLVLAFRNLDRQPSQPLPATTSKPSMPALFAAIAAGLALAIICLYAHGSASTARIGPLLSNLALNDGHGRNPVNVILVDIRALDTLGEIGVLAIGAIGAAALLGHNRRPHPPGYTPPWPQPILPPPASPILT
ncbi:MAG: hydrogen gas-evolving membrane-bound hydrogenase subunit E, partial [Planctomycetota bacterium]